jgi:hypothetical protein
LCVARRHADFKNELLRGHKLTEKANSRYIPREIELL